LGKSWCDYNGADRIDGDDPPLLEVTKSCKDTLSFVHIVEKAEAAVPADSSNPMAASKFADLDRSSEVQDSCISSCSPVVAPWLSAAPTMRVTTA
jgi:hypothetical protein